MIRKKFYDSLRRSGVNLTTQNVFGMERHLDYAVGRHTSREWLKYILATSFWETGGSMTPVEEGYYLGNRAKAFQRRLRYYPWYGRGLIQVTWETNYVNAAKKLGLPLPVNPERFLDWDVALPCLFVGMQEGWYTGKELDDYIDLIDENDAEDLREMVNARRIVNGTDKAKTIATLGLKFERALKASGYGD